MSVLIIVKVKADKSKLEALASSDPDFFGGVAEKGKAQGAIHHDFYANDDTVVVIDEWPSAQDFQSFFEGTPEIPKIMAEAGATEPPEIIVVEKLNLGDSF